MIGLKQRGSVTVIAATNRPDKIDPALLRPGTFVCGLIIFMKMSYFLFHSETVRILPN